MKFSFAAKNRNFEEYDLLAARLVIAGAAWQPNDPRLEEMLSSAATDTLAKIARDRRKGIKPPAGLATSASRAHQATSSTMLALIEQGVDKELLPTEMHPKIFSLVYEIAARHGATEALLSDARALGDLELNGRDRLALVVASCT